MKFNPFKSKTFWGAVVGAVGFVLSHGASPEVILQAAGAVWTAIGVRDAMEPTPGDG